jgi:hypothetical protein
MTTSLRTQVASISLAALVTLATLLSLHALAGSEHGGADQVARATATQPA